jgi:hypothetical protein
MMGPSKRLGFGTKAKQHFFKSLDLQECIKPAENREGLFTGEQLLTAAKIMPSSTLYRQQELLEHDRQGA